MKILPEWLTQRADNGPTAAHRGLPAMPALRIRMAWQKLQARAAAGDEVWAFANPSNLWKKMGRHDGYALLRGDAIVDSVVVINQRT